MIGCHVTPHRGGGAPCQLHSVTPARIPLRRPLTGLGRFRASDTSNPGDDASDPLAGQGNQALLAWFQSSVSSRIGTVQGAAAHSAGTVRSP